MTDDTKAQACADAFKPLAEMGKTLNPAALGPLYFNDSPSPVPLPGEWMPTYCDQDGWFVRVRAADKKNRQDHEMVAGPMTQAEAYSMADEHNRPIFREHAARVVATLTQKFTLAEQPGEAKGWDKAVMNMILSMPMGHDITRSAITFTYHGDTYNNALDCLTRHMQATFGAETATLSAQLAAICEAVRDAVEDNFDSTQPLPRWAIDLHNKAAAAMGGAK